MKKNTLIESAARLMSNQSEMGDRKINNEELRTRKLGTHEEEFHAAFNNHLKELGESNNNRRAVDSVISAARNVARAQLAHLSAMVPGTPEGDKAIHKMFGVAAGPDAHIGYSRARHQATIVRLNQQIMGESTLQKIRRVLNLGEQKITNKEKAEWHDAEADHLQGKSAASVAKWYGPNVKPAHAQEAHRRNIAIHREKAERHRKLFAELGESADAKRDPNGLLIQYHHASAVAMDHWNRGDNFRAVASQRRAEKHAEAYHKLTGKRVVDPLYVGNSPHIGSVAESYIGEAKKKPMMKN